MHPLRQGTATSVTLGRFVDDTDGKTPETLLTIAKADVRLRKGSGTFGEKTEPTSATHLEAGFYDCLLDVTDTGTQGKLTIAVAMAGALPWERDYWVYPVELYDAMQTAAAKLGVNVEEWLAEAVSALSGGLVQALVADTTSLTAFRNAILAQVLTLAAYPERSVGRRLYQMDLTLDEGTAQAGTTDSITLATTAPSDARLVGGLIDTTSGTGAFQSRLIIGYDPVTHKATVAPVWAIIPDATTTYRVSSHSQTIALSAQGTAVTLALTASDTAIANRALRRLGQPPVTALDGATPTSAVLRDLYSATRDALIADSKPRFARARANLAEDAVYAALTSKIGFTHRYPVPADYLAPVGLGSEEAPLEGPYVEEDGAILTDVGAPLPLRYVKRVTDASKFSAEFVDVFALFLAAEACYPITNSNTRTADLQKEGEQRRAWLRHAESVKATSPKRGDEDSLTRNRGG